MNWHPITPIPVRVVLPLNVVVCPCGRHYMGIGNRIRRAYCEQLRRTDELAA
jgi:hypothetical protein